ncbi:MAG: glycosyltransferase family 4 protein [Gammaproteobacteria bacterium]
MRYAIISNPRDQIGAGLAGSVAIVSYNIGRQLAQTHDVAIVVAQGMGQSAREQLEPRLQVMRVRTPWSKLHKYRELAASAFEAVTPHFLSSWYFFDFYRAAGEALKSFDPDVIHIQNYGQAAHILRPLFPRARFIVHLHDTGLAQVDTHTAKRIVGEADLILGCSEHVVRTIRAAHPTIEAPMRTVYNGVDAQAFAQPGTSVSAPTGGDAAGFRIAYVGRLSPEKGVHMLIDAFNRVIEPLPSARLDLYGGSAMFAYAVVKLYRHDPHWAGIYQYYGSNPVQRLMRQLHSPGDRYAAGLRGMQSAAAARATRFVGEQPHSVMAASFAASDLLVVPSVCDEPFGIPALEAMAAAKPVVATAAGGLPELVHDGENGLLVPRSDPAALAEAMLLLARSRETRQQMGLAGQRIARASFTWASAAASLAAMLVEYRLDPAAR